MFSDCCPYGLCDKFFNLVLYKTFYCNFNFVWIVDRHTTETVVFQPTVDGEGMLHRLMTKFIFSSETVS